MRKLSLLICLILGLALSAHAQGISISGQVVVNTPTSVSGIPGNTVLQAVPNAQITVCASTGGGIPCSPLVTIYSNVALSVIASNPATADANGNFQVFVPANANGYLVSETGPGIVGQLFIVTTGSSSGGGGTPCITTANSIQYNNAGVFGCAQGITTPDGNSLFVKGPAPLTDVVAFGARANNGPVQTTANFNSGNTTVNVAVAGFLNNNGITIQGAGPSITMSTPSAPTVVPQYSNSPTRDHILSNSPVGGSTYIYCVFSEDRVQGLTPCSTTTTIVNGPASLGKQTVNISTESLSNDVLTVNTSSGTFVAGMMVDVLSGVPRFSGPMRTTTGGAGTFTVSQYVYDSRLAPSNVADTPNSTSAAGTVVFYQANTITWPHVAGSRRTWICAARPGDGGTLHVIGQSDMSYDGTGWQGNQFEDYGAAYLANQSFPYYIKDSDCTGSGQPDALTTTVVSGGGTATIVVANAPSQTDNTNTKIIILDNSPNFKAAASQAGNGTGCMYISPSSSTLNTYAINSLTLLNSGICIIQSGGIQLNDTLELNNAHWVGWNQAGVPAFGFSRGAAVTDVAANPAVHLIGTGDDISNVTFNSNKNAATTIVVDNAVSILNTVNCQLQSTSDFEGICAQYRNTSLTIDSHKILGGSSFTSGLPQTADISWTPLIDIPPGQSGVSGTKLDIDHFSGNRRGISYASGGFGVYLNHYYVQGNITPQLTFYSTGGGNTALGFTDVLCDTTGQPMLADLGGGVNAYFHTSVSCSATNPIISGTRPAALLSDGYFYSGLANPPGRWTQNCAVNATISGVYEGAGTPQSVAQQVCYYGNLLAMLGGYPIYWPLPAPATPTLAGPSAGGNMPSGTFVYAVSATGFDGGETIPSPIPSSSVTTSGGCPGAGNCTVTVNWVSVVGAQSYNIWRCASNCTGAGLPFLGGNNWFEVGLHQSGTSFNDTINAPTNNLFAQQTGTGISQVDAIEAIAPKFVCPETTAPPAVTGFDITYCDSTHFEKLSNNGGSFFNVAQDIVATSAAFATATTAGTCVQNVTAVSGAATTMAVLVSPVSTPGVGAEWSAFVSSAGNVTINECAVATSAGGTIAFNIRVIP